jgi:hypothetical protein
MAIYDGVRGFVPVAGPLQIVNYTAGTGGVRQGTLVKLSSGTIIPVAPTGGQQIGVALAAGAAGASIPVNIDPETIYEATIEAADNAVAVANIGSSVAVTTEGLLTTTELSNQYINTTGAIAIGGTLTADFPFQIIGLPKVVTNIAAASNKKVLVKMNTGVFEPFV